MYQAATDARRPQGIHDQLDYCREDDGAVRIIRMNRPEKKNALTQPMYAEMTRALREAGASRPSAASCSQARKMPSAPAATSPIFSRRAEGGLEAVTLDFLHALAQQREAFGRGRRRHCRRHRHDHAAPLRSCRRRDRRVFSTPFIKLGLVPEAASSLLAPQRMGHARAFSMLVMGRPLSAAEAKEAGIVNTVVDAGAVDDAALQGRAGDRGAAAERRRAGAPPDARPGRRRHRSRSIPKRCILRNAEIRRGARRLRGVLRAQEVEGLAMSLAGKTLFITGASRGIGLAIALRAARDGANIAIAAKTAEPHPKLAGTIYTAAEEIERAGGKALPLVVDVRDEALVKDALDKTAAHFGGIDIVVNNASAIQLTPVATPT